MKTVRLAYSFSISILLIVLLASCRKEIVIDSVEKGIFLEESELGCYKDGHDYVVYDPKLHQLALNPARHTVRLQTDNQEEYYHMSLESYPRSIGVNILADFHIKKGGQSVKYTFVFECSKIGDGKLWLWNKDSKLGVVIPEH